MMLFGGSHFSAQLPFNQMPLRQYIELDVLSVTYFSLTLSVDGNAPSFPNRVGFSAYAPAFESL